MHADGGTGSAKMAESEREPFSVKSVGSPPPPVMRAVGQNLEPFSNVNKNG